MLESAAMPRSLRCAGLALLLLAGCAGEAREKPAEERRLSGAAQGWNVVLVSIDTLRADRLGAYGYTAHPTSPNMPNPNQTVWRPSRRARSRRSAMRPTAYPRSSTGPLIARSPRRAGLPQPRAGRARYAPRVHVRPG